MRHLLLAVLLAFPACAATDDNANAWFMYFGDHPIANSKWGLHLEGQWRRADLGLGWQQLLLRPAVNFQVNRKLALSAGYGFIQTHRYGDFPVAADFPEQRFFEQATITQRLGKLDFQNRLRFEQRHIGTMSRQAAGSYQRTSWRYENRFRYMLRTSVPINSRYYIGLYDEIMFNFGKNVAANVFDQNRAYIALGRNLSRKSSDTRLEIGFLEQTIQQRSGLVYEHNHTLQIAIYSRVPFFRR
jgi:hypothetical protein